MERVHILVDKETDLPFIFKDDLNKNFNYLLTWLDTKYSSLETKKDNLVKLMSFMSEAAFATGENRFVSRLAKLSKYCETIKDEKMFVQFYYNLLLGAEGKSLLNGFGFSNKFGDHMKGDPERQSIYR